MESNKLSITNREGIELRATLELPPNRKPFHYAIFAHCFTCSSDFSAVRNVSRTLANSGFGVIRFDFTGLGKSKGEFQDSHFSRNVEDLEDVAAYMKEHLKSPSLIIGHSLGGAAAVIAAHRIESIQAVATIGAPSEAGHVEHLFSGAREQLKDQDETTITIGGRGFVINKTFLEELGKQSVMKTLEVMRKPIMVLHSPQDAVVGIENAREMFQNAFHPKSFLSLDGADHMLTDQNDSVYAGSVIGSWALRYLPKEEEVNLDTQGEQVVGHLDVVENNFTTTIQTQKHVLTADEPKSIGGYDLGPSPYELLNASLAACTVMTLKMYAERKKWPLEEVYVWISHEKKHASDISGSNEKIDVITKKLKIIGDLDDDQVQRLKEIASKCPVHRTLISPTEINTELV